VDGNQGSHGAFGGLRRSGNLWEVLNDVIYQWDTAWVDSVIIHTSRWTSKGMDYHRACSTSESNITMRVCERTS
jgi:hypothetical protein